MIIPENLTDFLYWVKERTEKLWASEDWREHEFYGAKWQPLTEQQIDEVEQKYGVKFNNEHKEFLKILHAVDRKEIIEYDGENNEVIFEECTWFYNWLKDEQEIRERLHGLSDWFYSDVEGGNQVWLKSWGKKPGSKEEREKIFQEWFSKIPQLLPIYSHRFVVGDDNLKWNPIISSWGSDIIVMGWDFRTYLLNEIGSHLDIYEDVFDEEDQMFYPEVLPEIQEIFNENFKFDETKDVPYLKEMMLYWSSGWSSFGMNYYPKGTTVSPIVKTCIAEEEI
ncbi:hypothetical protein SAMN05443633_105220 [Chryseobacterium arachidis]|uniref:Knr4/Smi1-like domain-containing protein n=1 Tax=Chryseobacterium arachidis TaxID=1416778 RepID=A0A1M5DA08_9FLAO|nr:SMI1/KNR4 family protein [Chryseobacterium arachidis]SHF63879.1 hypothetical protein SAMN05443633_105220 [Chryseobacterium arachidis]